MRRVVLMFAVLAAVLVPAVAQKIETETSDRTRIVHLKTALNHLTVIEVGEPVVQVAAGSPTFKVEWRENKVFVQPTEADAATNLFIWTANQRLNYELEPADSVTNMDFAVDQAPVHLEPVKPTAATTPVPVSPSITELLLAGKPIRLLPSKQRASKPVEVWISDLYEKDGRLLVRYTVCNHGTEPYSHRHSSGVPVGRGAICPVPVRLQNSQLGDEQAAKLKIKQETPVKVSGWADCRLREIAPGEEAVGVVALRDGVRHTTHSPALAVSQLQAIGRRVEQWPTDADRCISGAISAEAQPEARHGRSIHRQAGLQRAEPIHPQSSGHWCGQGHA